MRLSNYLSRQAVELLTLLKALGSEPQAYVFPSILRSSVPLTTALLDRLTHHCHIVETGNESYRVTQATASTKRRIKAREQERRARPAEAG